MKKGRKFVAVCFSAFLLFISLGNPSFVVRAQDATPTPVNRTSKIEVDQIEYQWQLLFQSDNSLACNFVIDHEGQPTEEEIRLCCGQNLLDQLKKSQPCSSDGNTCTGLVLSDHSAIPIHRKIEVLLSPPSVWISLTGCEYADGKEFCTGEPELVFKGEEPLPNEKIVRISGEMAGKAFSCDGDECRKKISSTGSQGIPITFWADSSYGDSTKHFTAFVRVIDVEGEAGGHFIDVISDQWQGRNPPSCSDIWQVFPNSHDLPGWLDTPQSALDLNSSDTLYILSAALINNGLVDASSCSDNGLTDPVTANECGVAMAAPKVQYWQNLFDQEIFTVAQIDGVPAQLLKNMFLRESQLWPGVYHDIKEVGLGQLTENGADTTLLWNRSFFNSFCPLVLDRSVCAVGYAGMGSERQATLRGALLLKTNASCPNCPEKIDLTKVNFSIHVFTQTLKANCNQVNQLIVNTTNKSAREVSSYEDLWRFTLVNYNAGPGCLGRAIKRARSAGSPIDWSHVMPNLDAACQTAVKYVVDISNGDTADVTTFSTPLPAVKLSSSVTPTITPFSSPTVTLTPTASSILVTHTPTSTPEILQPTATDTP